MNLIETTLLLIFGGLAIAALFYVKSRHRRNAAQGDVQAAIEAASLMQQLFGAMQQHRGMSSAWLAGDASFEQRLIERQREINVQLRAFLLIAERETAQAWPCFTRNDAVMFRHHWEELVSQLAKLSSEQAIARHTRLITQVIDWLAALGEARIRLASPTLDVTLARNFTERLPLLAECLGQARALGSSSAASGMCSPVARVRLAFLASRAESLLLQASAGGSGSALETTERTCIRLIKTIREDILQPTTVTISAGQYFELATQAIDGLFDWMRNCGTHLNNYPQQARPSGGEAHRITSTNS